MSKLPEIKELKSLLEQYYKKNVEILQYHSKLLTEAGENYGGVMVAVNLSLKIENEVIEKHLVAKRIPANEVLCSIFNIQHAFKKELNMYLSAIPALADLEDEFGIRENKITDMFVKCLGGRINLNASDVVDEDAVILMENIKVLGYDIGDRLTGFDLKHAELLLRNLAQFHAVPIALKLLKPNVFQEKILPAIKTITLNSAVDGKCLDFMIQEVTDYLKNNESCAKNIEKVIISMKHNLIGPFRVEQPGTFSTVVHSDYWTNNTMVLKDLEGNPIHNKMVDFQLPMYNSGVYDLLFFIFSSIAPSVLEGRIDYFIKLYYDSFIERLSLFNIDLAPYSWEEFNKEILRIAPMELGHTLFMFKPILTRRGVITDMSNYSENVICEKNITTNDFGDRILNTVSTYIERNWI